MAAARLRLGRTFSAIEQDAGGVDVVSSKGSQGRCDLAIGNDTVERDPVHRALGRGVARYAGGDAQAGADAKND